MQIWLANSMGCVAYEHELFTLVCSNLRPRRGLSVKERFQCLHTLASLPWLEQPRSLDSTHLIMEVYAAWDELWTTAARDLAVWPCALDAHFRSGVGDGGDIPFGEYLARPLHSLAAFAASTTVHRRVRAGTHRELVSGVARTRGWRVIPGGVSSEPGGSSPASASE